MDANREALKKKKTRQEYMASVLSPFRKVDTLFASFRCFDREEQMRIVNVWNEAAGEAQKNLETLLDDVGIVTTDDSARKKSTS